MRKTLAFALFLTSFILAAARPITACIGPPPLEPSALITRAEVIVRATALYREELEPSFSSSMPIRFKVEEVLKGEALPATLAIGGALMEVDDFNDHPAPYKIVRPGGRRGGCIAATYKKGAEYLLFLKKEMGQLTPYWASLSPTNEQLRGPQDAWLTWVRAYLQRLTEPASRSPAAARWSRLMRGLTGGWTSFARRYLSHRLETSAN